MAEILVVDDEPAMRRLVARMLNKLGHNTHEAASGQEGLELFDRINPALVITDIVMDQGEGIETIRALRQKQPTLPILAISGGTSHSLYLRTATKLGATASLAKPFLQEELVEVVNRLLSGTAAARET
jgi:CheY-like chemotaxis protein